MAFDLSETRLSLSNLMSELPQVFPSSSSAKFKYKRFLISYTTSGWTGRNVQQRLLDVRDILSCFQKDNSGFDSQNAFWKTRVLKLMSSRFFWCSNHVLFYSYYLDMHNWNVWLRNHHSMTRLNQSWWVLYAQSMEKHSCRILILFPEVMWPCRCFIDWAIAMVDEGDTC